MTTKRKRQVSNGSPWRNRIVESGVQAADQFIAHPDNWRVHPREQETALLHVMDRVGWVQEVIVSKRSGYLVDGHLRVKAALAKGDDTPVPYKVVDVTENEEALLLTAYDPIGAMAIADQEKLAELVGLLADEDRAIALALHADKSSTAEAPKSFPTVDENVITEHICPKCGYEWSGGGRKAGV